ncbi:nuclear transport factor 2 family protein [Mycobacterium sp. Aquia_216]|uniref:nuclear transport factor 2 family protein n=1 Tax=Mycobacterium sp. Aquia_216 TaxID=2991729 RepID=UPI00227BB454|nr:nuclear transport factor 2 family protein [Mycobacterium sp. Aquia_216]WAJ45349.1 nuclear transport factor 2 family protein [Mycobacterium sp. Aquia_216]
MSDLLSEDQRQVTEATRGVITAAYTAAKASDMARITEILDPDVVLHEAASLGNGGVHRGIQNVLQAMAYVFETFDMAKLTVDDIVVDRELAVGLVNLVFRDREGGCSVAEVWRVHDGRIVEVRPFYWDTAAIIGAAS